MQNKEVEVRWYLSSFAPPYVKVSFLLTTLCFSLIPLLTHFVVECVFLRTVVCLFFTFFGASFVKVFCVLYLTFKK